MSLSEAAKGCRRRNGLACDAQHLLENEALHGKPGIELTQLDLLLELQQLVEAAVQLGGAVVGRLSERFLQDKGVLRKSRLQVGYCPTTIPNRARLQQAAPVADQRVKQPGWFTSRIEQ